MFLLLEIIDEAGLFLYTLKWKKQRGVLQKTSWGNAYRQIKYDPCGCM